MEYAFCIAAALTVGVVTNNGFLTFLAYVLLSTAIFIYRAMTLNKSDIF